MGLRDRYGSKPSSTSLPDSQPSQSQAGHDASLQHANMEATLGGQMTQSSLTAKMRRNQELLRDIAARRAPVALQLSTPPTSALPTASQGLGFDRKFRPLPAKHPAPNQSDMGGGAADVSCSQAQASRAAEAVALPPGPPPLDPAIADGIDREAARAAVVLGLSPQAQRAGGRPLEDDLWDLDASEVLAQRAQRGGGGQRGQRMQQAQQDSEGELGDAVEGAGVPRLKQQQRKQRAAGSGGGRKVRKKAKSPSHGKDGAAPMKSQQRQRKLASGTAAEGEEEGGEEEGAKGNSKAGSKGRSGGAKRKAKQQQAEDSEGEEEGQEEEGDAGAGVSKGRAGGKAAKELMSALDDLIQLGGSGSGAGGGGGTGGGMERQVAPRQAQAQQAVEDVPSHVARPNLANVATGGPDEPLVLRCDDDGNEYIDSQEGQEGEGEGPAIELQVPATINKYLRSYQREGVRFLFRQYGRGQGGILADDMGLGKTVQCVAFCAAVLGKEGATADAWEPKMAPLNQIDPPEEDSWEKDLARGEYEPDYQVGWPILIVCPTSVIKNWEREFNTWGSFRIAVCHGKSKDSALAAVLAGQKEVMITSYDVFRLMAGSICRIPWHLGIFDEAHKLKNDRTKSYMAAARFPSRLRYGLTGTPMQNDYLELWCLMNWAVPNCLGGKKDFLSEVAAVMKLGNRSDANFDEIQAAKDAQTQLSLDLREVLLRRTKALIAQQLPQKRDHIVFCKLSDAQLAAYRNVLASPDCQLLLNAHSPCHCGSGAKSRDCCGWQCLPEEGGVLWPIYHLCDCDNPFDKLTNPDGCKSHKPEGCWTGGREINGRVIPPHRICPVCVALPVCTVLRKISNHLELVKANPEDEKNDPRKYERDLEVAEMVLGREAALRPGGLLASNNFMLLSDARFCGKLAALEGLLGVWKAQAGANKVLLFSSSVRLLKIIESLVTQKGYDYLVLDGSTGMQERQQLCDQFNSRPSIFIFLISTHAGGVGLNLTGANKVVIFDPSWNPSHDLQAQDRAFRIGQKRDVDVYRFVAAGTIEELVYTRQMYKQQHANMAVQNTVEERYFTGAKDGDDKGELWGLANLLKLNAETVRAKELIEGMSGLQGAQQAQQDGEGEEAPLYRIADYDAGGQGEEEGSEGEGLAALNSLDDDGQGTGAARARRAGGGAARGEQRRSGGGSNGGGSGSSSGGGDKGGSFGNHHAGHEGGPGAVASAEAAVLQAAGVVTMRHDLHVGRGPEGGPYGELPEGSPQQTGEGGENAPGEGPGKGTGKGAGKSSAKRQRREATEENAQAAEAAGGGRPAQGRCAAGAPTAAAATGGTLGIVASLALWQGASPVEMARRLQSIGREGRAALMQEYILDREKVERAEREGGSWGGNDERAAAGCNPRWEALGVEQAWV